MLEQALLKAIAPVLFKFGQADRATSDTRITEEYDLAEFSLIAKVILLPGHSRGSIGIHTAEGDLFAGDLFESTQQPRLNSIMDDLAAAQASVKKLKGLNVQTIYPGHGQPFALAQLMTASSAAA